MLRAKSAPIPKNVTAYVPIVLAMSPIAIVSPVITSPANDNSAGTKCSASLKPAFAISGIALVIINSVIVKAMSGNLISSSFRTGPIQSRNAAANFPRLSATSGRPS